MAEPTECHLIITVVKATLIKSSSKIDTFANVEWINREGRKQLLAKTPCDRIGNFDPFWDYHCTPLLYERNVFEPSLALSVYSKGGKLTKDTYCGNCQLPLGELLTEPKTHPYHELDLFNKGKKSGTIFVNAVAIETKHGEFDMPPERREVDEAFFETPVERLDVSGGTAPFFNLVLKDPAAGQSPTHYIGKDLEHATDEIDFYENVNQLTSNVKVSQAFYAGLFDYMFAFAGCLTAPEKVDNAKGPVRELLVLRNLRDRKEKLRLLDLKIGFKTAESGWQGKTWLAAKRQNMAIDQMTNTVQEGFRLEGFDGLPNNLHSMDPVLDGHILEMGMSKQATQKKLRRRLLQQLNGAKIFSYFLDLHQDTFSNVTTDNENEYLYKEEYAELVLSQVVHRLARLSVICHNVLIPQKWIGSSVALGYDCGNIPLRSKTKSLIRSGVIVNIFDWGRSTLNTPQLSFSLTPALHKNYTKCWKSYVQGIDRLSWNAAQFYFNRYGNSESWNSLNITIFDYDSMTADDKMGELHLPMVNMPTSVFEIKNGSKTVGTLTCSIEWVPYPDESRLIGIWRLFIIRAQGLPNLDRGSVSDPYCEVKVVSTKHEYCQYTCVRENTLNPVWNEVFEIPLVCGFPDEEQTFLSGALEDAGTGLGQGNLGDLFGSKGGIDNFDKWEERLRSVENKL